MQKSLFTIEKKNSRLIEISTPFNVVENYIDNNIVSLQCGDTKLSIGEFINVQIGRVDVKYKIRSIIKHSEGRYTLVSFSRNKTSTYILPCLGISKSKLFSLFGRITPTVLALYFANNGSTCSIR